MIERAHWDAYRPSSHVLKMYCDLGALRSIPIMFLLPIVYVIKIYLVAYLIDRSEAT